jgi:hypothetical protein
MTFNNSCSFAGMANLLSDYSIDREDYEIAIAMKVPYIFKFDDESQSFLSGSMLQQKKYFDYCLQNYGLELIENIVSRAKIKQFFENLPCKAMLGLHIQENRKHAVIFCGNDTEKYHFLNNKRKDSSEPDFYQFDFSELLEKLDETVIVSYLKKSKENNKINILSEIQSSIAHLKKFKKEVNLFCSELQPVEKLNTAMNKMFRAFFLDVFTMLELIGESELAFQIGEIRKSYLKAMRLERTLKLADFLSLPDLNKAIDEYERLIIEHAKKVANE